MSVQLGCLRGSLFVHQTRLCQSKLLSTGLEIGICCLLCPPPAAGCCTPAAALGVGRGPAAHPELLQLCRSRGGGSRVNVNASMRECATRTVQRFGVHSGCAEKADLSCMRVMAQAGGGLRHLKRAAPDVPAVSETAAAPLETPRRQVLVLMWGQHVGLRCGGRDESRQTC